MSNLKLNNNNNQNNSTANDLPDLTNISSGTNNQNNQMRSNVNTANNNNSNTNNSNESFVKIQEDEGPKLFQNKKMNRIFIILGVILGFILLCCILIVLFV